MKQILKPHAYKQWEPQLNEPLRGSFDERAERSEVSESKEQLDGDEIDPDGSSRSVISARARSEDANGIEADACETKGRPNSMNPSRAH